MIRYATPKDHEAIRAITAAAFGRDGEAELVDALRAAEDSMFELVADEAGEILGHVMFSRLWADRYELYAALAPLSVRPDRQRSGLGSALVRTGLERAPEFGASGVLVLGDPAYYGRFGFSSERAARVACPFSGLPALQALDLDETAFDGPLTVAYPDAFGA